MQDSKGASPLATGPSQAEPEVSALRASVPSAEEARKLAKAASDHEGEIRRSYETARAAVDAEWGPKLANARSASSRALAVLEQAIANETPDHELTGQRVFRIEKIRDRWSRKEIGENRIEGIIETYRPGVNVGRGYGAATGLRPGEIYVRLLKKDGKLGTKTEHYKYRFTDEMRWQFASGIAARSDETPAAAQPEGQEPGPQSGDAQPSTPPSPEE